MKPPKTTTVRNIPWKSLESEKNWYRTVLPRGKHSCWLLQVSICWIPSVCGCETVDQSPTFIYFSFFLILCIIFLFFFFLINAQFGNFIILILRISRSSQPCGFDISVTTPMLPLKNTDDSEGRTNQMGMSWLALAPCSKPTCGCAAITSSVLWALVGTLKGHVEHTDY